jgi:transposase
MSNYRASTPKSARLARDPLLDVLQLRLRGLAREGFAAANGGAFGEVDARRVEIEAQLAQTDIFVAIEDEKRSRLPERYERLRAIRAWEVGKGEPFETDDAARKVRMASLKLGIASRRHSEEEAIEASRGIKYEDLSTIEQRAVEIVLGRRRAVKNKGMEPASRIANQVRSEWIAKVPPVQRNKGKPISVSLIVRVAVPILDQLAGKAIASGIPTSHDPRYMEPSGIAALFVIVQLSYGTASLQHVYKALLEFRRDTRTPVRYPSDLTEAEWAHVKLLIPPARRGGNRRHVDEREVVNGLMYVLSTGCQWRAVPKDLPPRSTLYDYFARWRWDGTLDRIDDALVKCREATARARPSGQRAEPEDKITRRLTCERGALIKERIQHTNQDQNIRSMHCLNE